MSIRKILLWYFMLTKRLFCKFSFIVLLCIIPLLVAVTNSAMSGESGILTVLLCSEDENPEAEEVINSLLYSHSVILFKKCSDAQSGISKVQNHKADAVWCFEDNFDERAGKIAKHQSIEPLVTVYEREDSIPLQLSREKLYGAIYSNLSYRVYENFVYTELIDENRISADEVEKYFNKTKLRDDIVELEKTETESSDNTAGYLLSPLRGMLSLAVVVCGLAAVMYFLKDKKEGKFDWIPSKKRIVPAFAQCCAAVVPAALMALIAVLFTEISVGIAAEIIYVLMFAIAVVGFCLLVSMIFCSPEKLASAIPAVLIAMLVLSPIFFNINALKPAGMLFPSYYYLNYVYNPDYLFYFGVYTVCLYVLSFIMNLVVNKD